MPSLSPFPLQCPMVHCCKILATLLVDALDIPDDEIPEIRAGKRDFVDTVFSLQIDAILLYLVAFLLLCYQWSEHAALFSGVEYINTAVSKLNMVFLFVLSLLPFSTASAMLYSKGAKACHDMFVRA